MKFNYHIEGMHCSACIEKITAALSPQLKKFTVTFDPPLLSIDSQNAPSLEALNKQLAKIGDYKLHTEHLDHDANTSRFWDYYPIFLITLYIAGVAFINNFLTAPGSNWMTQFMAGFFLVFSAFKFLDLHGFADGYSTYDLLGKLWHGYGFIYPFLELALGILYLGHWVPVTTAWLTIIIMGFSSLGVINSLVKQQKIRCACLGTILKVPLSSVTLIEDLAMVIMAAILLIE